MAERKATNKYYPPDWDPSKGSINKYQGSHPLRERARKLHQGILIIRFELPFNIWCDGCNNHIGMGVRYNAQKSKVGMYYTTPLYKFRMKCHLCDNHFEIQNDPKNLDYIILNGARRQEGRWDPKENGQIDVDKTVSKKIKFDAMFKLENEIVDKSKAVQDKGVIESLEQFQTRLKDDYSINCSLRKRFRTRKKDLKFIANSDVKLLKKSSLPITMKLASESETDSKMAQLMKLQSWETPEENKLKKRHEIMNQSIFQEQSTFSTKLLCKNKKSDDNPMVKKQNGTIKLSMIKNEIKFKKSIDDHQKSSLSTLEPIASTSSSSIVFNYSSSEHED